MVPMRLNYLLETCGGIPEGTEVVRVGGESYALVPLAFAKGVQRQMIERVVRKLREAAP